MLSFVLQVATLFASTASASCECGYRTNEGDVWQSRILTNFSSDVNSTDGFYANWFVTDRIQGALSNSTPYQINYTNANVIFPDPTTSSPKLTLIASGYSGNVTGPLDCAQIETNREDILYGSFRASYAVNGPAGACSGFFSYADDTNENDIEVLTMDGPDEVHFTNQPADSTGATMAMTMPNNGLTTSEQVYRFDWTSEGVRYYVNDNFMTNITRNPSALASQIMMNSWSNGGSFTSGPPVSDVQVTITYMHLYFNTSSSDAAAEYESACAAAGGNAVCSVDSSSITTTGGGTAVSAATSSKALAASSSGLAMGTALVSALALTYLW